MVNTIRKSFWLVEGGRVSAASQDTEFDGNDSVLIYARNEFEALVIAEAYGDGLVGVDNVMADNGEVAAAAHAPSDDTLEAWIQHYLTSDSKDVVAALTALAPKDVIEKVSAYKLLKAADEDGSAEISTGVLLHTAENLQEEQESWDEEDGSNDADFSCCPYWVVTNDGKVLGIADAEELSQLLESLKQ